MIFFQSCTQVGAALTLKSIGLWAGEALIIVIDRTTVGKQLVSFLDKTISDFFNFAINETPNYIDVEPLRKNRLLGRKSTDHIYKVGGENSSNTLISEATITIPTQQLLFKRLSEGSPWELTQDSKAIILQRMDYASIQLALKILGYDPGRVDGILGKRTRLVLKEYQKNNGLNPTGDFDELTRKNLIKI